MTSSVIDIDDSNRQVCFTPDALKALMESSASTNGVTAFLIVRDGKRWADVHQLRVGAMITLGRVASNEITVQDARCSRQHCAIYDHDGEWFVRDLGSRNGTRLNGEKISSAVALQTGDKIRIGHTKFMFTRDASKAIADSDANDHTNRNTAD